MSKLLDTDLLALGELFDAALEVADVDGFDPMPDGEYPCHVLNVEITKTKTSNKLMATWRFKVMEGEEGAGRNIFKNAVLTDNPKNLKRFMNDVAKFGIVATTLGDLLGQLEVLKDEVCLVQLKTDDQNRQWVTIDTPEV